MTKEEFNKVWKDTSREGILNQFYYDYRYMQKLKEDINKAIDYLDNLSFDGYCDGEYVIKDLIEILGGNNE